MADLAGQIGSTLQSASLNRHPSPRHDINPSTAASAKEPIRILTGSKASVDDADIDDDEIPLSILRPIPRRQKLPPLPDLRFEQSYLRSIEKAQSWSAIAWITFKDQVCLFVWCGHGLV